MRPLVICCSQRFKQELYEFVQFLEKKGVLVFSPNFRHHRRDFIRKDEDQRLESDSYRDKVPGLVWAHFNNIETVKGMGGVCLIFNPLTKGRKKMKYGYVGSNTQGEVGGATILKMPLIFLRPHREKWMMAVAHEKDKKRIFTNAFPEANPLDYGFLWENWLKLWLGAPVTPSVQPPPQKPS